MKRLIATTALLFASSAWAQTGPTIPGNIRIPQNIETTPSTGTTTRYLAVPDAGAFCALILNGTTRLPHCYTVGTGLSIVNGVMSASQAQADWNATSGASQILNKPTLSTIAYTGDWADLLNKPATWAPSPHTHAWADITSGKPTTLAGYGITDGVSASTLSGYVQTTDARLSDARTPLAHTHAAADVAGLQAALDAKQAALGFTPYNATNPAGYITSAALTPYATTASLSGYVTSSALTALGYVTPAGARSAISLTTTGSGAATYNATTGVLNVPTPTSAAPRVFANPVRSLNTAFQISASRDAQVVYTVDISVTSLLLAGASGRVYLEYADDAAFTTNVITVNSSPNATGGVLNVTNLGSGNVTGLIPAGKYVRIRTQNVASTPTFTFQSSQEVLL